MKIRAFRSDGSHEDLKDVLRVEVGVVDGHGEKYRIMLLDAEDTFDVILVFPEGTREVLHEITQKGEYLGN